MMHDHTVAILQDGYLKHSQCVPCLDFNIFGVKYAVVKF